MCHMALSFSQRQPHTFDLGFIPKNNLLKTFTIFVQTFMSKGFCSLDPRAGIRSSLLHKWVRLSGNSGSSPPDCAQGLLKGGETTFMWALIPAASPFPSYPCSLLLNVACIYFCFCALQSFNVRN